MYDHNSALKHSAQAGALKMGRLFMHDLYKPYILLSNFLTRLGCTFRSSTKCTTSMQFSNLMHDKFVKHLVSVTCEDFFKNLIYAHML